MENKEHGLKRHLKARHIRLMALGSTIGVGLFLGSATAIQIAGPSILLAYLLAGMVAFVVLRTLGEMAVHEPVAGSFASYASTYVSPLTGYMWDGAIGPIGLLWLLQKLPQLVFTWECGSQISRNGFGPCLPSS